MLLLAHCTENPYRPCYKLGTSHPSQGLLQVESFQSGSEHLGGDPAGDSVLAAIGSGGSESSFVLCPGETLPREN